MEALVDEITIDTAGTGRMFKSDGRVVIGNATGTQPSATVGGAQFYGGSYPGDFRISSGAGAVVRLLLLLLLWVVIIMQILKMVQTLEHI